MLTSMQAWVASFWLLGFPPVLEIVLALLLDWLLGGFDFLNPAKLIGAYSDFIERLLRKSLNNKPSSNRIKDERMCGVWLLLIVVFTFAVLAWAIPFGLAFVSPFAASVARVLLLFFAFGARSLFSHARTAAKAVASGDKEKARKAISGLSARDTAKLSLQGAARVTVESIAINTNQVVIAPLFYALVGYFMFFSMGCSFAWVYMAIMVVAQRVSKNNISYYNVAYYINKTVDVLGIFPSRLTGIAVVLSALITGNNAKRSFQLLLNENGNCLNPVDGWSMASYSGALGIKLGGGAYYEGIWKDAPTIGFDTVSPEAKQIHVAALLMIVTQVLCAFFGLLSINAVILVTVVFSFYDLYKKIKSIGGGFGGRR